MQFTLQHIADQPPQPPQEAEDGARLMDISAETEVQFITRTIAMFLSLAGLAEKAAAMPWPIRAFVLWVLRRAERAAQDYVGVEEIAPRMRCGSQPGDALDLAESFRELAWFLDDEFHQDRVYQAWWRDPEGAEASPILACLAAATDAAIRALVPALLAQRAGAGRFILAPARLDSS